MKYTIDEIFDMLDWSQPESVQQFGIKEASSIKHLHVFILPCSRTYSKNLWENCAKVLAAKSDDELEPFFGGLLEWLQDLNWPGAEIIYNRLGQVPYQKIKTDLGISLKKQRQGTMNRGNIGWNNFIMNFMSLIQISR